MAEASKAMAGAEPVALPAINVGPRETRVFAQLAARDIDALIVTSPTNSRWLTGFAGSNATVVVADETVTLFTDNRYRDRAPDEIRVANSSAEITIAQQTLGDEIRELIGRVENVGLEADHITWLQQTQIAETWLPDQTLVPTSGLVDELRARKDAAEVARIERAAQIVDAALESVTSHLTQQPTEQEFGRALEAAIRSGGADDLGFDAIIAAGANGAIPHHNRGDRRIESGDLVIVDVGGMIDGYRSDMTRTFCVGALTAEQRRHYDTVIAAQQAGVDAMVAGASTAEVDAAARAVITEAGWGDAFTHGTGHGIGLDIHELPRVAKDATDHYELGTVATVEPGVYLRGQAGVRIEDTCVVTDSGARRLTGFPKDPEIF